MEEKILEYQLHVQCQLKQDGRQVELCAAADEKFFDQVVLVMLDLPSGYILVEELTENRQYLTWQLCSRAFIWKKLSRSLPMACLSNGRAANT
jgi:hypothetical protein